MFKEASTDTSKLLAVDVFLPIITDFDAMNAVYDAENPLDRTCVEASPADPDLRGNDGSRSALNSGQAEGTRARLPTDLEPRP